MNWYNKLFRKVHWDFDNPPFVKDIGKKFGPEEFSAILKKANIEVIDFFLPRIYLDSSILN